MKVATFYSYKGGTGRTLALANVASFAATAGKRVFVLDMDLEAPGATYKLLNAEQQRNKVNTGLVGYFLDSLTKRRTDLSNYVIHVDRLDGYVDGRKPRGALWLMPAGRVPDPLYFGDLKRLNLDARVEDGTATVMFQNLISAVRDRYDPDLLLIDSRTGITGTNTLLLAELADEVYAFVLDLPEQLEGTRSVLRSLAPLSAVGRPMLHAVMSRLPLSDQQIASGWIHTENDRFRKRQLSDYLSEPTHPDRFTLGSVRIHQLHHNVGLIDQEELLLTLLGRRGVAEEALTWDYARLARAVIDDDGAMATVAGRLVAMERGFDAAVAAVIVDDPGLRGPAGITRFSSVSEAPVRNLPQRIDAQRIAAEEDPAGLPQLAELLMEMSNAQAAIANQDASIEAAAEAATIYGHLAAVSPEANAAYAYALSTLAIRFEESGRSFESIQATQQAVDLLQKIPKSDKQRDSALALSLLRLASLSVNDSKLALASVEDAVKLFRRLERRSRRYASDLRRALVLKSNLLASNGQRKEALQAAEESLLNPSKHVIRSDEKPGLIVAMSTHAVRLAEVGDLEGAKQQFEAAIRAADDMDYSGGEGEAALAGALQGQSLVLAELSELKQADQVSAQAVRLYQKLAKENADYRPQWAIALRTYGSLLLQQGRQEIAVAELELSVRIIQELAKEDFGLQSQLATSLCQLSLAQVAGGHFRDAASAAGESVRLSRFLVTEGRHLEGLGDALAAYSGALLASNHLYESFLPARESVEIFERLSSTDERMRPKFAMALIASAQISQRLSFHQEALYYAMRAEEEFRLLILTAQRFRHSLARCLSLVSSCLIAIGRMEDALGPLDECVLMLRQLAREQTAVLPELAEALLSRSVLFHQLGRASDSIDSCKSSISIYRGLADSDSAYAVTLQAALRELAKVLDAVGDVVAANEVREEAELLTRPHVNP